MFNFFFTDAALNFFKEKEPLISNDQSNLIPIGIKQN